MRTGTRLLAALLLLTSWASCDRPTPVAPAESALTITANPTRIAVDGEAIITVLARKSDGTAVNPGTEINFATTLGTIDTVVATDDRGIAEATLRGDLRIGMATVTADSGAAGTATIEIQIGALASFIDFTATPETINKDLPPGGEKIKLKAIVRDDLNNVIRGIAVAFEADIGTLESGGSVTNNNGVVKDTLTVKSVAGITDGVFEITARAAGDDGSEISEIVEITVTGFAFNITLTVQPTSIPAAGGVIQLSALVRDDEFEAAVGEQVNFITEAGNLDSGGGLVTTDAGGQASDTLRVTQADLAALPATAISFNVSAEVGGGGGVLVDSGPVPIRIQPDPPIADFGVSTVGLTATFSNTTLGDPPFTFVWDFGDGDSTTATTTAPVSHSYEFAGTYFVTLTAINDGGDDSITKEVTVEDPIAPTPQLSIAVSYDESESLIADPGGDIAAGDTLRFDIVVNNSGDVDLSAVTVASNLTPAPTCLPTVPVMLLQPAESIVCEQDYVVTTADVTSKDVTNLVQADSPDTTQVADTVTVTIP
ncbi:MAG: PKD domain-containing protein [bacterium]|nr:PKD domain-containing protein [bacterium]